MGLYLNPASETFTAIAADPLYVDKTGIIEFLNSNIGIPGACRICNSRPRRFGKTFTANMLTYYYCKTFDANNIFSGLEIGESQTYKKHLNKYNVIYFDIQACGADAGGYDKLVKYLTDHLMCELHEEFPDRVSSYEESVAKALLKSGEKYVFIIDEWDAPIRSENTTPEIVDGYYEFLKSIFKRSDTMQYLSLAFMTGILPIKRVAGQSALNEFDDYTMTSPMGLARFIGFTESEVEALCVKHKISYKDMCNWYDGYRLGKYHVFNPKSVVTAVRSGVYNDYWANTSLYTAVTKYIDLDFDRLKHDMKDMLSGDKVKVDIGSFANDTAEIRCKDDVITYLIHLGYLAYDFETKSAYIPNKELMSELHTAVEKSNMKDIIDYIDMSDEVLRATLNMDGYSVGNLLDSLHSEIASSLEYNDENSLSNVIINAFFSAKRYYLSPKREVPSGKGFADIVYLPKPEYREEYPALVVELKWDKSADTAINQIKERKYPKALEEYTDNILLVGINYDKQSKNHECLIEKYNEKNGVALNKDTVALIKAASGKLSPERLAAAFNISIEEVNKIIKRK